jgi:uncharacterized protein YdaU (DUF1376 family)
VAQHRDAPAFQEYAASILARTDFRVMSLAARGLLFTMRLECWVNESLPGEPDKLARVLGYQPDEVSRALPEVMAFFRRDGANLRCPELDDYRAHLLERRARQAEGGRAGAAKTNSARTRAGSPDPPGDPQATRESLVQNSQVQNSQVQPSREAVLDRDWVNSYEQASRGH